MKQSIEKLSSELSLAAKGILSQIREPAGSSGYFPPVDVCRDFKWWCSFNLQKASDVVTGYYGVPRARLISDKQVEAKLTNQNIIGQYKGGANAIYLTKEGRDAKTLLHELFHHICYHGKAPVPALVEEKAAGRFAEEILKRAK
jgi:hypothetical protein